jgi:hypothetical protein
MAQQTVVMKLFAWMTKQGYEVEYEIEMSFLDMEKEQIMNDFQFGKWNGYEYVKGISKMQDPSDYYNVTYKK